MSGAGEGGPRIVVLSAPSGGGKTTIAKAVRARYPDRFGISVSATTRAPRPDERDGDAYYFLTRAEFERRRAEGDFLESAEYAGHLYGTLKREVDRVRRTGRHVLLDIEVDGAEQIKRLEPDAIRLFILPTSPQTWMERLYGRQSESPVEIRKRLERALAELAHGAHFDRLITNDDLDQAVREVVTAVAEGGRKDPREPAWKAARLSEYGAYLRDQVERLKAEIHH
ncbi:MAG: guanylate kinase [Gemmatimonadales bacterium]